MTYRIDIRPAAAREMEALVLRIGRNNPAVALEWFADLQRVIQSLENLPDRCSLAPEHKAFKEPVRRLLFGKYRILFVIRGEAVHVLHVRHGAREYL